jgi:hypothetical protein
MQPPLKLDSFTTRPLAALALNFTARFFDFDLIGMRGDLRSSYLWLIAGLAPIGLLMPWFMVFEWPFIALDQGPAGLRIASMAEKSLYLGLSVIAPGALTLLSWQALLVDRRDALILGSLPIVPSTIMRAKVVAIALYGGLLSVGMHLAGAFSFALLLADGSPFSFLIRGVVAHFVSASMASAFALCAITSLQGGALALLGPRAFRRVSPILQMNVTAALLLLFLTLPPMSGSVADVVRSGGLERSWLSALPPVWFLGLYDWLLGGSTDPILRQLAARAALATAGVAIATIVLVPLAGRRLLQDAVAGSGSHGARSRRTTPLERFTRLVSRIPARRAATQMLLTTCGRVNSHRFAFALAGGVFAAFAVPVLFSVFMRQPARTVPPVSVLAIPLVGISVSLVALRVAAGLSSDLRAGWMCAATVGRTPQGTVALRRTMWLVGILPMSVLFAAITWVAWDFATALALAVVAGGLGFLSTEALTRGLSGIPCTQAWQPLNANVRAFWPVYLGGIFLITQGLPRLILALAGSATSVAVATSVFAGGTVLLRLRQPPIYEDVEE